MLAWLQKGTKRARTGTDSDDDTALGQIYIWSNIEAEN